MASCHDESVHLKEEHLFLSQPHPHLMCAAGYNKKKTNDIDTHSILQEVMSRGKIQ
jgi:hypothetical protein